VTTILRTICWHCGDTNELCSDVTDPDAVPEDGCVSICFQCGKLALFDFSREDKVRKPTPTEMDILLNDQEVQAILLAWHVAQQHQKVRRRRN
jgi:hypothetical protein